MKNNLPLAALAMFVLAFCVLAMQASAAQKTLMGFQGKATNSSGDAITSGNITINISTGTNCLGEVFNRTYINNFTRDGIFDIMLGEYNDLELDYNQDYYICISMQSSQAGTSSKEQVGGPYKFRGGQGQIGFEDLSFNYTNNTMYFGGHLPSHYAGGSHVNATFGEGTYLYGANESSLNVNGSVYANYSTWAANVIGGAGAANLGDYYTEDWVNESGDVMTGDLNISTGTGFVNISAAGSMNLTGNITGAGWNLLKMSWSYLSSIPHNIANNYTAKAMSVQAGSIDFTALAQNYTAKAMDLQDSIVTFAKMAQNYTNNTIYFAGHIASYFTNHFGYNYTNNTMYLGGHAPSYYTTGGNITYGEGTYLYGANESSLNVNGSVYANYSTWAANVIGGAGAANLGDYYTEDWVNESGDVMTGDLNISTGMDFVNISSNGNLNLSGYVYVGGASGNSTFQDDVKIKGTLWGGSNLKVGTGIAVKGNLQIYSGSGYVNITASTGELNTSGDLYVDGNRIHLNPDHTNTDTWLYFGWSGGQEYLMYDKYQSGYGDDKSFVFSEDIASKGYIYTKNAVEVFSGSGYVNITAGGNIYASGYIEGNMLNGSLAWGNLTSMPDWISNNYTAWSNIGSIPHHIANNYTGKAMSVQDDSIGFAALAQNYTAKAMDLQDSIVTFAKLAQNYTNNTMYFGGHLPSHYLGGGSGGGITQAMIDAFVNRTGDTMTDDLNIYSGSGYVNITAGTGTVNVSNDMTVGDDLNVHGLLTMGGLNVTGELTGDKTVNLDNSSTTSELQSIINEQPRNLGSHTLTFQFADGDYSMDDTLEFDNFYNGNLFIQGNTEEPGANMLHTNQTVFLDGTGLGADVIKIVRCHSFVSIKNLKIQIDDAGYVRAIILQNVLGAQLQYSYLLGSGTTNRCYGVNYYYSSGMASKNYVSNVQRGFAAERGFLYSVNNDDTGTKPKYGLVSGAGGHVGKWSTQPTGATADEYTETGGIILQQDAIADASMSGLTYGDDVARAKINDVIHALEDAGIISK